MQPVNIDNMTRRRHLVQWSVLALVVLFPFTGLFEFSPGRGVLRLGDHLFYLQDFSVIVGAIGVLLFTATVFFYPLGQSFCGWMCPQFTVSEALSKLLQKLLGRHMNTGFDPDRDANRTGRSTRDIWLGWLQFAGAVTAFSLVGTLTVMHYIYPTSELLAQLMAPWGNLLFVGFFVMLTVYFVFDFGLMRHFWCRYMCAFGLYQYLFRGRDTLRIRYSEERASDCKSCTLCKDVCPMGLDPRQPEIYTRCINCGICIDGCESYMGRFDKPRLLEFGFGSAQGELLRIESGRPMLRSPRVFWPLAGALGSAGLLMFGLMTFVPLELRVHQDHMKFGEDGGVSYSVVIHNRVGEATDVMLAVSGLPEGQATLAQPHVRVSEGTRVRVPLQIDQHGLEFNKPYPFTLTLTTDDGLSLATETIYMLPSL